MATRAEIKNRSLPFLDPDAGNLIKDNLSSGIILAGSDNNILPYIIDQDGYTDENSVRSPVQPTNLIFPGNNKLSNSVSSYYNSVTDFKTFGCYIHHDIVAGLPPTLYSYNPALLYGFFQRRDMIQQGAINVFPKLTRNQFTISQNLYNRTFRTFRP